MSKEKFVTDASGPVMPKDKRFHARVSLAMCHYHAARVVLIGATFSVWAMLGSLTATPGVVSAWVLALVLVALTAALPKVWIWLDKAAADIKIDLDEGAVAVLRAILVKYWPNILALILFCPLLSAPAVLPLSALFLLVVQLSYSLARLVLEHIGVSDDSGEQVWVDLPKRFTNRGCCRFVDTLAGPTRTCLSWLRSTSIFSHVDAALGRSQGLALAFTSTSYATLAGGLSCFWVLLALAPLASHIALVRARSLSPSSEYTAAIENATSSVVGDLGELTGEWSWVWGSLMQWLSLGAAFLCCCCSAGNVRLGRLVYKQDWEGCFPTLWVDAFAAREWDHLPVRTRWFVKNALICSLFALVVFIFTASQTDDAKSLIAISHASSFESLKALQLDLNGVLPSFDELADVLIDPPGALSSVVERIANLSSYAELDPAYFADGVGTLAAINLLLSFVKLLATYGRKLFALLDAAKAMLKTNAGYEAASDGEDGAVQVYETTTDLEALSILDLLSKSEVTAKHGVGASFAKFVPQKELAFDKCGLTDGNLAGLVALATHCEMTAMGRSLTLKGNTQVTAQGWKKALPKIMIKGSVTSLDLDSNDLGPEGGAAIAEGLKGNTTLSSLSIVFNGLGFEGGKAFAAVLKDTQITNLNIGQNLIGVEGGKAVAAVLKDTQITELNLSCNRLTDGGEDMSGVLKLAEALPQSKLTSLDVDGYALQIDELRGTKPTETIDLSKKSLGVASAFIIASCIKENVVLKELNLENNRIGDEGSNIIAGALPQTQIINLNVLKNKLGDGADALVAAAREMPQLVTLCGLQPEQAEIDLSQRDLDAGDAKLLAFDLSKNQAIKTLNLQNNALDDAAKQAIRAAAGGGVKLVL